MTRNNAPFHRQRTIAATLLSVPVFALAVSHAIGQVPPPASPVPQARLDDLLRAVERTQQQIEASQRDLQQLRQQLLQVQAQLAASQTATSPPAPADAASTSADPDNMQASQIATLDQVKVETASKYPLRLTGTILLNGFSNSGGVDQAAAPTSAFGGGGSVGLSVLQTTLGLDADGPHLFGATSRADLRVDFFGSPVAESYATSVGLLRLRTAHASLIWKRTELFFALDRPLLNPQLPESLLAAAQPEMAWSGNLWSWVPQAGISHTLGTTTRFRLQAALIDPLDPVPEAEGTTTDSRSAASVASLAERSRRPGVEARVAMLGSDDIRSAQFGLGGYFSPHLVPADGTTLQSRFDAWAATLDYRLPLRHGLVLNGSLYRGAALGGLGGGGYKDYVYRSTSAGLLARPLDDTGGWSQLHQKVTERISWNLGFGLDNAFSGQLRTAAQTEEADIYSNIARNRTIYANVLFSPSAYLVLSAEYRHLYTAPVFGTAWTSHTTGVGAAYRF